MKDRGFDESVDCSDEYLDPRVEYEERVRLNLTYLLHAGHLIEGTDSPVDIVAAKKRYDEVAMKRKLDIPTTSTRKNIKYKENKNSEARRDDLDKERHSASSASSKKTENNAYQENVARQNPDLENIFMQNPNQENRAVVEDKPVLFVQKDLTSTDVSDHHQRFSVPCKRVINHGCLTEEEEKILKKKEGNGVKATLIDPIGREYNVTLKIEKTGKTCVCYKITKPWNEIRKNNGIQMGTVIQLWASRPNGSDLCLNLTIVDKDKLERVVQKR